MFTFNLEVVSYILLSQINVNQAMLTQLNVFLVLLYIFCLANKPSGLCCHQDTPELCSKLYIVINIVIDQSTKKYLPSLTSLFIQNKEPILSYLND